MKKFALLLPLLTIALVSCGGDRVSDSPKESVKLSEKNYSTYVAINTSFAMPNAGYADIIYFSYFIGADYCKFVDCTITYKYVINSGSVESPEETVPLTLSGDGQANPYYARLNNRGYFFNIVITGASGTVQVYR